MLTRRTALLSTLAAGACATGGTGDEPADAQFRNIETLSESVHSGVASGDGEKRLTVRLCRYPELRLAWIWIHARTPDGFFSYVDHLSPAQLISGQTFGKTYRDNARTLEFLRTGEKEKPDAASIYGQCLARKTTTSTFGQGEHKLELSIQFTPERAYTGLNKGRTEVFGRSRAKVTIDGKLTEFEGPAQFHEQDQTAPRFTAPFCYISLWGDGAAATLLIAPNRRDGYLLEGDRTTEATDLTIDPPGAANRNLQVKLADGRELTGEVSVVQAYTIPLVGTRWRGHMVNVRMDGRVFRGHVNDYGLGAGPPYGWQLTP